MKKLISLTLILVMLAACLSGLCFAANPIAEVTNGSSTTTVDTVSGMLASVNATGNTVIKLLKDVTNDAAMIFPYPCTLDLNGFTLSTNPAGNACTIAHNSLGSKNSHTLIKNGTIVGAVMGIRHTYGSLEIRDCTIISPTSVAVGLYGNDTSFNSKNLIDNCVLVSGGTGAFSWHSDGSGSAAYSMPQAGMNMTITNSKLVQITAGKHAVFTRNNGPATVTLGEGVEIYSAGEAVLNRLTQAGNVLAAEDGTHTFEVNGQKYEGLKKWVTTAELLPVPEPETPAVPETPAAPAEPETPAAPETPELPTPELPAEPEAPAEPETPEEPEAPAEKGSFPVDIVIAVVAAVAIAGVVMLLILKKK